MLQHLFKRPVLTGASTFLKPALSSCEREPTHTLAHVTAGGQQRLHLASRLSFLFLDCFSRETREEVPRTRLCCRQQLAHVASLAPAKRIRCFCVFLLLIRASKVGRLDAVTTESETLASIAHLSLANRTYQKWPTRSSHSPSNYN